MEPKRKIVFWGTPFFARTILAGLIKEHEVVLVVTQPDKPQGRSGNLVSSPVKELAEENNIPVRTPAKASDIIEELKGIEADFYIVAAYGQILPQAVIDLPRINILNVHASRLPRYRGASPIQAAILNGDKDTGNSIMVVTKGLDAGPVLAKSSVEIASDDTTASLTKKLAADGSALLNSALDDYDCLKPQPQDDSQATFTKQIKKEDGRLDWQEDAETIERKIRAYNPWPLAFDFCGETRLNILKAAVSERKIKPGKIEIADSQMLIGTDTLAIEVIEIQPAGKKPMEAKDFINGYRHLNGQSLK